MSDGSGLLVTMNTEIIDGIGLLVTTYTARVTTRLFKVGQP